jgi:tRNA threonylcarbamoyladenosine modification (KEOPS) complex  Pcc1 subunit
VYGKQQYKVVNEYAIQFGNRKIRPDLVIEKDGEKLVLEIKKSDASAYNKIFLTYELWILYKSKYKLHPTK